MPNQKKNMYYDIKLGVLRSVESIILRTWDAESLCLGSEFNIFLTRSLAPLEIEGQGSEEKSMWPRKIELNIPVSDSAFYSNQTSMVRKDNECKEAGTFTHQGAPFLLVLVVPLIGISWFH